MNQISLENQPSLENIIESIQNNLETIQAFKLKSLAIFGSVARNEATENSDIDILIDFVDKATFDNYMDLKFFLEELFDRSVDLVTQKSLKSAIRQQVLDEAVYVTLH